MNVFGNYSKLFAYAQELFANSLRVPDNQVMDTKNLLTFFGDKQTAMDRLGIYRQKWDYWEEKGIPHIWQRTIESLTAGKLIAKAKRKAKK